MNSDMLKEHDKIISAEARAEALRWIPILERLPRDNEQYLVSCQYGVFIAVWNPESECWDDEHGGLFVWRVL